jgi:hypothetical protein
MVQLCSITKFSSTGYVLKTLQGLAEAIVCDEDHKLAEHEAARPTALVGNLVNFLWKSQAQTLVGLRPAHAKFSMRLLNLTLLIGLVDSSELETATEGALFSLLTHHLDMGQHARHAR